MIRRVLPPTQMHVLRLSRRILCERWAGWTRRCEKWHVISFTCHRHSYCLLLHEVMRRGTGLARSKPYCYGKRPSVISTHPAEIKRKKFARPGQMAKEYRATPVGRLFDAGAARTRHPWLTKPKTLGGGEFLAADKMLSENLPVRMNTTRGRQEARKDRRRRHSTVETQPHALNECRTTGRKSGVTTGYVAQCETE